VNLIVLEVVQGARDEIHARRIEHEWRLYAVVSMLDGELAFWGEQNHCVPGGHGVTIRKTVDIIIGTFCTKYGHAPLHDDRDFAPMETHLGPKVV